MNRLVAMGLALAICGSTAMASSMTVRVLSGGSNSVEVLPGETVNYEVVALLGDDSNQGLALIGFDLSFDGGDLAQASAGASLRSFVIPEGITNPRGYGGTDNVPGRDGDLVQVGGAQNTINNVDTNAPYPLGAVVFNLGQSELVVATGSLTAPQVEGPYTLAISAIFANAIKLDQPAGIDFWVVEEVTPTSGENLSIFVTSCVLDSSAPSNCAVDASQPSAPDGSNPAGLDRIDLTFNEGCTVAGLVSGDIVVSAVGGAAPTISDVVVDGQMATVVFNSAIPLGAWTCVEALGSSTCVGALPGDVSGDGVANAGDVTAMTACLSGGACDPWQCDVDGSGACTPADLLRAIDLLNGAGSYSTWMGTDIGACPNL